MSRRKPPTKPLIKQQPDVPPLSPLPPPTTTLTAAWKWVTALLVCAYIGLSLGHLYTVPVLPSNAGSLINAPDEPAHIGYVKVLAEEHRQPTQVDRGVTYEWHQPPLYYVLALPFYSGGAHAMRWLGLLLGTLSLGVIFLAARRLFPNDPVLAVFALGFAALLPMRQAVYASVGNDPLVELLFAIFLYQIILAFTNSLTLRRAVLLGLTLGAAMLTKANGVLLIPVALTALYLLWRGGETPGMVGATALYMFSIAFALVLPWYLRNYQLYHEFTPVRAFMHEFEGTSKATDWIGTPQAGNLWTGDIVSADAPMTRVGYLQLVSNWTSRTFFAAWTPLRYAPIGRPLFLPPTFYVPYALLGLATIVGMGYLHFKRRADFTDLQVSVIRLFGLLALLVAGSFVGFIMIFFQAQGRYLYPLMPAMAVLIPLGCRALIPVRYRDMGTSLILGLLFILALAFLVVAVQPAYA